MADWRKSLNERQALSGGSVEVKDFGLRGRAKDEHNVIHSAHRFTVLLYWIGSFVNIPRADSDSFPAMFVLDSL